MCFNAFRKYRNLSIERMEARAEKRALTVEQLRKWQKGNVNYFMYDNLADKTLADLFDGADCAIILLDIHNGRDIAPVGHFIAVINQGSHIEHFDSYGLNVDEELSFTHDQPHLSRILNRSRVITNGRKFQRFREDVNTCGRWCVVRCNEWNLRKLTLVQFGDLFDELDADPDEAVTLMTWY
jgi:hypothetical protein